MLPRGEAALRAARIVALAVPAGLLAGAYVSQYGFGLFPCEMCWWQRYAHFSALPFALLAFGMPRSGRPVALAVLGIAASALIGGYHAGVEYHWWDGFTACTSTADLSSGNALDAILNAPMIRCDQAQWTLAGISLAGYNFLFSGAGALLAAVLLARSRKV
ncbi:MAG TPA: disulfide bond formation protein B [Novosphingobium sp.]|nr:disulfide bond formation protein B [Novosphingobium sp.]